MIDISGGGVRRGRPNEYCYPSFTCRQTTTAKEENCACCAKETANMVKAIRQSREKVNTYQKRYTQATVIITQYGMEEGLRKFKQSDPEIVAQFERFLVNIPLIAKTLDPLLNSQQIAKAKLDFWKTRLLGVSFCKHAFVPVYRYFTFEGRALTLFITDLLKFSSGFYLICPIVRLVSLCQTHLMKFPIP